VAEKYLRAMGVAFTPETIMASSFEYRRGNTLLDLNEISFGYSEVPILKNLSATVTDLIRPNQTQGQIIGLLGPSGIGKTTLFNIASGIVQPWTGSVTLGSERKAVSAGDVGVVAQKYPLLNHYTILKNLVYAATKSGLKTGPAQKLAKDTLHDFGLGEHASKYPEQLSGGQRQRIAIAQQLICSENYIILDEPFSGLDVVNLAKVRQMLIEISNRAEQNTFIVVTHDVTAAVSIADTIWLMGRDRNEQGEIIPGARIMESIDLLELDIAWHETPTLRPNAPQLIHNIKQRFLTL
jgi:ABC-type nitrate/sulfonate/bicarbonate transport system ATPase subunit